MPHSGLDLAHVVHSVEWLAQLHALSYVVLNRHSGGPAAWLSENRYSADHKVSDLLINRDISLWLINMDNKVKH